LLLQLADEVAADLIALTTHGRGALERVWLGSVADQLVRSSTIPLLLLRVGEETVPPFAEESYPTHVLVPLDGSEAAEAVLGILGEILPGSGGRVTLMTVLERPAMPPSVYLPDTVSQAVVQEKERERAESHLAQVEGRLERRGSGTVEHVVVEAKDVSRRLLDECEASDVDLIALATEGRGAVARFFVGSVADKLIRGSHLPILVARRPESPDAA
jgi:nucleotide-binding universal stress UspA family protein